MGHSCKLQSTWFAFISNLISFFKVLKKVSLLWHHPFAFLFLLLLFTSPMQPIIKFFSPLIMCTLLCIVAFISFSSLMDKARECERHVQIGCEIASIDVLGLRGDWPAYQGFQPHNISKQEGDLNSILHFGFQRDLNQLMEESKSKATVQTKNGVFDEDPPGGDVDCQSESSLKKENGLSCLGEQMNDCKYQVQIGDVSAGVGEPEREGSWVSETYAKLQPESRITHDDNSSYLSELAVKKERKTRVKFKDEIIVIGAQLRDEAWVSQMHDAAADADDLKQDDGLSSPTEEAQKSHSHGQIEDVNSALDEQKQDRGRYSGLYACLQQDSNLKPEDGFCFVAEKIEEIETRAHQHEADTEIQIQGKLDGMDVLGHDQNLAVELYHEFQLERNSKREDDFDEEVGTPGQIQEKINGMDVLGRNQNLAGELHHSPDSKSTHEDNSKREIDNEFEIKQKGLNVACHAQSLVAEQNHEFQPNSNSKYEDNHFKQEFDCEVQIKGKDNEMNVLVYGQNLAAEVHDEFQLDSQGNYEGDSKPEIESEEVQIEDKMYGMDLISRELQPYRNSKKEGVSKQEFDLAPQKWRDWVRGVETDGLSLWTLEKGILRIVNEKMIFKDFDEEFFGVSTMEEEFICSEAFTAADENGGALLEKVSAFIQEFSEKLQDIPGFEAESDQTRGLIGFAYPKDLKPPCTMNDARELILARFSHEVETLDDFHTEEGDESSRWDEALDTTEKESMDSENEVGMIWSSTSDVSDLGATITEEELHGLKQKYHALEKEFEALQGETSLKSLEQKAGTRKNEEYDEDFDGSLDPYVRLFAEYASDIEDEVRDPPQQSIKFSHKISSKIENSRQNTVRTSLDTKSFLRKPRVCCISSVIRAIRGKRL